MSLLLEYGINRFSHDEAHIDHTVRSYLFYRQFWASHFQTFPKTVSQWENNKLLKFQCIKCKIYEYFTHDWEVDKHCIKTDVIMSCQKDVLMPCMRVVLLFTVTPPPPPTPGAQHFLAPVSHTEIPVGYARI